MSDSGEGASVGGSTVRNVLFGVAVVYVALSMYFLFEMHGRIAKLESAQQAANQEAATHNAAIMKRLGMTEANVEQAQQSLQSKLGQTQKEVAVRTSQLARQQQASEQKLRQ